MSMCNSLQLQACHLLATTQHESDKLLATRINPNYSSRVFPQLAHDDRVSIASESVPYPYMMSRRGCRRFDHESGYQTTSWVVRCTDWRSCGLCNSWPTADAIKGRRDKQSDDNSLRIIHTCAVNAMKINTCTYTPTCSDIETGSSLQAASMSLSCRCLHLTEIHASWLMAAPALAACKGLVPLCLGPCDH